MRLAAPRALGVRFPGAWRPGSGRAAGRPRPGLGAVLRTELLQPPLGRVAPRLRPPASPLCWKPLRPPLPLPPPPRPLPPPLPPPNPPPPRPPPPPPPRAIQSAWVLDLARAASGAISGARASSRASRRPLGRRLRKLGLLGVLIAARPRNRCPSRRHRPGHQGQSVILQDRDPEVDPNPCGLHARC